ncbi:MAG: hypothetical protein DMG61_23285 [Acidobacteria bacterium]|nr:MAG: hypothetical protein DMG61_23285 [Acidobacteriota bacterium]PYY12935.1 MAG: hypothetical protein DMG60_22965 [Acidobacteriota bacterium]
MLATMREILKALFVRRSDAPWYGYVPVLIVVAFFTLLGLEDEGVVGVLHFIILFVIGLLQLRYRTLAGWGLLFSLCLIYGAMVLATPDWQHIGESVFFAACGFVPAAVLFVGRPRNVRRTIAQSRLSGNTSM